MYPANPAALLSYLVLCLIECDMLGRQKSRLIQSNKLPWAKRQMQSKGAAAPHNITHSLLTHSFYGLFFQLTLHKINWPEKSRSWIFNVSRLIVQIILVILSWMFNRREWKAESFIVFCVALCISGSSEDIATFVGVYCMSSRDTARLVGLCMRTWICVRQIPKLFDSCMHSVVIIKPKSYVCQGHYWSSQNKAAC